jgi:uncharacterized protein YybS (DUF2232 family)
LTLIEIIFIIDTYLHVSIAVRDYNLVRCLVDPFRLDVNPSGSVNKRIGPDRAILRARTVMGLELDISVRPGVIVYIYFLFIFILILYIFIKLLKNRVKTDLGHSHIKFFWKKRFSRILSDLTILISLTI